MANVNITTHNSEHRREEGGHGGHGGHGHGGHEGHGHGGHGGERIVEREERTVVTDNRLAEDLHNYGEVAKQLAEQQVRVGEKVKQLAREGEMTHEAYILERESRLQRERELEEMRLDLDSIREKEREYAQAYEREHMKFKQEKGKSKERENALLSLQEAREAAEAKLAKARERQMLMETEFRKVEHETNAERGLREKLEGELRLAKEAVGGLGAELAQIVSKQEEITLIAERERQQRKVETAARKRLEQELLALEEKMREGELLHRTEMKEERKRLKAKLGELAASAQFKDATLEQTEAKLRELEQVLMEKEKRYREKMELIKDQWRLKAAEQQRIIAGLAQREGELDMREQRLREQAKQHVEVAAEEAARLRNRVNEAENRARRAEELLIEVTKQSEYYNSQLLALGVEVRKVGERIIQVSQYRPSETITSTSYQSTTDTRTSGHHPGNESLREGGLHGVGHEGRSHEGQYDSHREGGLHQGELPAHQGGLPAHQGGLPAHQGGLPAHQGGLSAHQGGLSAHQGGLSAHEGGHYGGGALANEGRVLANEARALEGHGGLGHAGGYDPITHSQGHYQERSLGQGYQGVTQTTPIALSGPHVTPVGIPHGSQVHSSTRSSEESRSGRHGRDKGVKHRKIGPFGVRVHKKH